MKVNVYVILSFILKGNSEGDLIQFKYIKKVHYKKP